MRRLLTLRARGQALIETAVALPAFLLVMFGVIWALQTGVMGERVELVARYGGMVSAQSDPYQHYSLYAAYSAAAGSALPVACATPPPGLIENGGPLADPAKQTLPFWQPSAGSATATTVCGRALASGGSLSAPMLLARAAVTVQGSNDVPAAFERVAGSQTQRAATMNAFRSPDMATLIGCYGELQNALGHSISPGTDMSAPAVTPVIAQPATGALTLSGGCGG